jgi:hypothetical protein
MNQENGMDRIARLPLPVEESELPWYREKTAALLRRYFRLAVQTGRLPGVLGREFFRARATSQRMHTFEDSVIFVHDMERCLERLDRVSRQLIARRALQGHTEEETAGLLGCSRRQVSRLYPAALDRLSAVLLRVEILRPGVDVACWREMSEDEEMAEEIAEGAKKPVGRVEACQEPAKAHLSASA